MITCKMFIAEEVTNATHGRLTLHAVNFTRSVAVPVFPYKLRASYICLLDFPEGQTITKATLSLQFDDLEAIPLELPPPQNARRGMYMEWRGVDLVLPKPGTMRLTFRCEEFAHEMEWEVVLGPGGLRATTAAIPPTAVVDGRKAWDPLDHLKGEVVSKLTIADPYLTPEFLRRFLDERTKSWKVRVITSEEHFNEASPNAVDLKVSHPNLEVRFDNLFHDRLLCRDDEEIYTFGASLKDTMRGRVSFFQRIYDQQQTTLCIALLEESWGKAKAR